MDVDEAFDEVKAVAALKKSAHRINKLESEVAYLTETVKRLERKLNNVVRREDDEPSKLFQ
jgi:molecular chaperone GrpE (heat shock protein)